MWLVSCHFVDRALIPPEFRLLRTLEQHISPREENTVMKREQSLFKRLRKELLKKSGLTLLIGGLVFSSAELKHKVVAMAASGSVSAACIPQSANGCLTQAAVQINHVRYVGKNSTGQDEVEVDWLTQSLSECFLFGSGKPVAGKNDTPPFGYEITVKIKRRLGHEDSATVTKREIIGNSGSIKTIVRIPRANLETDPVSFTATLKTTVGAVLTKRLVVSGTGAPSLAGATQNATRNSTIPDTPSGCYPLLNITGINFIPGSGTTPDNVSINWGSGAPPTACFDPPKFSVQVNVTRPGGQVDKVQTTFSPGSSTATLQLSGAPGAVVSFHVVIEAISGAVIDKTSTRSGDF
jgi:hypothetical protein